MGRLTDKTIYAIQHNKTKRIYVGCSLHYEKRIREHISHLRCHVHQNKEFQKDYDLYGEDYSYYVIQKNVNYYDSFDVEKHWIRTLGTNNIEIGYNLSKSEKPMKITRFEKVDVKIGKSKVLKVKMEKLLQE